MPNVIIDVSKADITATIASLTAKRQEIVGQIAVLHDKLTAIDDSINRLNMAQQVKNSPQVEIYDVTQ